MVRLTKQEQESAIITAAIFTLFLILIFFLKYTPPEEEKEEEKPVELLLEGGGGGGGATINFGSSGSGAKFQSDVATPQAPDKSAAPSEEVVGSSDDKAQAVANTQPVKNRDRQLQNPKPQAQADNTPKKPTNAALDNLLGGSDQGGNGNGLSQGSYGSGGTGNGNGGGNGSGDGTGTGPGSGSGSGGGSGSGRGTGVGNYNLAGRKALNQPKPRYTCNAQGTVVIQITVDDSGKVIKAERGRGTTNPAQCLFDQARQAALNTKFDKGSVATQVGTIRYNFTLTE